MNVQLYFSEVDKHAIAIYKNNFKNQNMSDQLQMFEETQLPKIDASLSEALAKTLVLAGKRKGMGGQRSVLILKQFDSSMSADHVFVWENVKGTFSSNNGEDFAAILQAFANIGGYRLEWQLL